MHSTAHPLGENLLPLPTPFSQTCSNRTTVERTPWCVWLTDFGIHDGAVSEVLGVMYGIHPDARISYISHDIHPFSVSEAAWRLYQSFHYWPSGTYFVCVVDPDVGTSQASLWCQSKSGHIFLAPNNGLLGLIDEHVGWVSVRSIDRCRHMASFQAGDTSYGRDLYAPVAANLLAGLVQPNNLGPEWRAPLHKLPSQPPVWSPGCVQGSVVLFDRYGNLWTDISLGDARSSVFQAEREFHVTITHKNVIKLDKKIVFNRTYASVAKGQWVMYGNSMNYVALATCCGDARDALALSPDQISINIQWNEKE